MFEEIEVDTEEGIEVGLEAATEEGSEEGEEGESFIPWVACIVQCRLFRVFTAGGSPANVDARLANIEDSQQEVYRRPRQNRQHTYEEVV